MVSDSITVSLRNCRFFARHGVIEQERQSGNEFEVSISVRYEVSGPNDDEIENTISYADLYEIAKEEMEHPRRLLETVVRAIADRISKEWSRAKDITVELIKITPPIPGITGSAAVTFTHVNSHS